MTAKSEIKGAPGPASGRPVSRPRSINVAAAASSSTMCSPAHSAISRIVAISWSVMTERRCWMLGEQFLGPRHRVLADLVRRGGEVEEGCGPEIHEAYSIWNIRHNQTPGTRLWTGDPSFGSLDEQWRVPWFRGSALARLAPQPAAYGRARTSTSGLRPRLAPQPAAYGRASHLNQRPTAGGPRACLNQRPTWPRPRTSTSGPTARRLAPQRGPAQPAAYGRASHLNQRPTAAPRTSTSGLTAAPRTSTSGLRPWAARLPRPLVVPPRPQPRRAPQATLHPGRARGTAPQPTTASHHVPRSQGTQPTAGRKLRAEGSRDGRRATSSTSGGGRRPRPAALKRSAVCTRSSALCASHVSNMAATYSSSTGARDICHGWDAGSWAHRAP